MSVQLLDSLVLVRPLAVAWRGGAKWVRRVGEMSCCSVELRCRMLQCHVELLQCSYCVPACAKHSIFEVDRRSRIRFLCTACDMRTCS